MKAITDFLPLLAQQKYKRQACFQAVKIGHCKKKNLKAIEENEDDIIAVLDIMETIARNVITDDTLKPNE